MSLCPSERIASYAPSSRPSSRRSAAGITRPPLRASLQPVPAQSTLVVAAVVAAHDRAVSAHLDGLRYYATRSHKSSSAPAMGIAWTPYEVGTNLVRPRR
jgi:hypothetical protein